MYSTCIHLLLSLVYVSFVNYPHNMRNDLLTDLLQIEDSYLKLYTGLFIILMKMKSTMILNWLLRYWCHLKIYHLLPLFFS